MNFPWIKRSVHQETLSRFQALTLEYQNYRRRNAEIQSSAYSAGQADAALELLPVYDNLLRALEQPCQDECYVEGIRMTLRCLQKALETLDITEVPALGQPFDPAIHEAMEHIQDDTLPENTVAKVVQQGFMQRDKLLRPALVVVAN